MRANGIGARLAATCVLALTLAGCEGVAIPVTVSLTRDFELQFDTQTSTSDMATISRSSILDGLDVPDDAEINSVSIESVRLILAPGAGNVATAADMTFSYEGTTLAAANGVPIQNGYSEPLDNLVANAVNAIKADLEGMVVDSPSAPSEMTIAASIGPRTPTGSRLVVNATVQLKLTVSFIACEDLSVLGLGPQTECSVGQEG